MESGFSICCICFCYGSVLHFICIFQFLCLSLHPIIYLLNFLVTMKTIENLDFKEVGRHCPVCFNQQCPSSGQCLRYVAGQQAGDDDTVHLCVLPKALKGDRCGLFAPIEKQEVAYGFGKSYENVTRKAYTAIRSELIAYFGCKRSYYWYQKGEKPLLPEQRAYVENVFARHGYGGQVVFDQTDSVFVLNSVPY